MTGTDIIMKILDMRKMKTSCVEYLGRSVEELLSFIQNDYAADYYIYNYYYNL